MNRFVEKQTALFFALLKNNTRFMRLSVDSFSSARGREFLINSLSIANSCALIDTHGDFSGRETFGEVAARNLCAGKATAFKVCLPEVHTPQVRIAEVTIAKVKIIRVEVS